MTRFLVFLLPCLLVYLLSGSAQPKIVLAIHGGAGTIEKSRMGPQREKAYREKLREALKAGYGILQAGGSSVDAVQATIRVMEDSPLFNAGKGSVLTHDGRIQMDASLMEGAGLRAGAVAGVSTIRNPIDAARAVMEKSPHVLLAGRGAEAFARQAGCVIVDTSYFYTPERRQQYLRLRARQADGAAALPARVEEPEGRIFGAGSGESKFGTVGCVALDNLGNLAAGTSTGGMMDKLYDRIGDSPIIGAGTYANNASCAVSCTGWGEFFMRTLAAKTVSDLMAFKAFTLKRAADSVIFHLIPDLGGDGGMIALDQEGHLAMPFNTPGMFRGFVRADGTIEVQMYKDR